jgi:peptide/nickel transport system permease protein
MRRALPSQGAWVQGKDHEAITQIICLPRKRHALCWIAQLYARLICAQRSASSAWHTPHVREVEGDPPVRRYVIRRLLQAVLLLFVLSIVLFTLIHAIPGGPERVFQAPRMTAAELQAIKEKYGLDKPLYVQYIRWLTALLHGDLGISITDNQPVVSDIGARVPATVELFVSALSFALIIAIIFGVVSAVRQYSFTDYSLTTFSYLGISMPIFWFGLILQQIFGVALLSFFYYTFGFRWPIFGRVAPDTSGFTPLQLVGSYAFHLVLPTIVLSLLFIAQWSRYLRSSMLDTVKQDYVRTARAKGLSSRTVFFRHALRNALIPFVTVVAIDFGGVASGAVITETVFAWPGMGLLFLDALNDRNYPILLAMLLLGATSVILFNLIADILYGVIDPRIRYS